MNIILDENQINETLDRLRDSISGDLAENSRPALVGIRSRGEIIAQRLAEKLSAAMNAEIPCGTLDITLYRDDINNPQGSIRPQVRTTEIPFDIEDRVIILVDDVLYTGRSVRAAMDALIDLGRPKAVKLAVLVERPGREFPIQADYTGTRAEIDGDHSVIVNLAETDSKDRVFVK